MRKIIICLFLPCSAFADSCTDAAAQTISNSFEQVAARWSAAIVSTMPGPNSSFGTGYFYVGTGVTPPSTVSIYRELGWDLNDISDPVGETDGISTNWYVHSLNGEPVTVDGSGPLSRSLTLALNNSVNSLSGLSCGSSDSTNCCCVAEINSVVSAVQSASGDIRNSIAVAVEQINSKMFTEINDVRRNQYYLNQVVTNGFNTVNSNLLQLITLFNASNSRLENIEDLLQNISEHDSGAGFDRVVASIDSLKNSLALEVTQQSISGLLVTWTNYIKKLSDIENTLLSINANLVTISGDVQSIFGAVNRPEWMDTDFWPAIRDLQSSLSSNGYNVVDMGIVTNIYNGGIGSWSSLSNFWQGVSGREGYGISPSDLGVYVAQFFDVSENWDFWGLGIDFWDAFESENYERIKNTFVNGGNTLGALNGGASLLTIYEYARGYKSASEITNELQSTDETIDEFKADFESQLSQTNQYHFSASLSNTVFFASDVDNLVFPSVDGDVDIEFVTPEFAAAVNGGAGHNLLNLSDWHIRLNIADFDFRTIFEYVRTTVIWLYRALVSVTFLISIWGLLPALSQFIDKIIGRLTKCIDYFEEFIRKLSKF